MISLARVFVMRQGRAKIQTSRHRYKIGVHIVYRGLAGPVLLSYLAVEVFYEGGWK